MAGIQRRQGVTNGICVIDSSVAGLGGCTYANGASGNVASEDVVYLLNGLGIETGIDLDRLADTCNWIAGVMEDRTTQKSGWRWPQGNRSAKTEKPRAG